MHGKVFYLCSWVLILADYMDFVDYSSHFAIAQQPPFLFCRGCKDVPELILNLLIHMK